MKSHGNPKAPLHYVKQIGKREAKFMTTDQSRNKKEGPPRVQAEQRLNTASRGWQ